MAEDVVAAMEMRRQALLDEGDEASCSEACVELAVRHLWECEYSLSEQYAEQALGLRGASAWATAIAGVVANAARYGLDEDVDLSQLADASVSSESVGEFYTAGLGWCILADRRLDAGEYRLSIEAYGRAELMYQRAGALLASARIAFSIARAHDALDQPELGTQALERAVARATLATPTLGRTLLVRRLVSGLEARRMR